MPRARKPRQIQQQATMAEFPHPDVLQILQIMEDNRRQEAAERRQEEEQRRREEVRNVGSRKMNGENHNGERSSSSCWKLSHSSRASPPQPAAASPTSTSPSPSPPPLPAEMLHPTNTKAVIHHPPPSRLSLVLPSQATRRGGDNGRTTPPSLTLQILTSPKTTHSVTNVPDT
ncbi:hypothetical protein E2C01_034227 [Portunus trituberculatus]|uniref:Uncharacterized protein n=1 Tax=Portunus trituberculatus TaxID=210409 RepID=A0A5B7F2A4_PORTR|nr:hypothetical protein [Portunus trituberculatus]